MRALLAIVFLLLLGGAAYWLARDEVAAPTEPPSASERTAERAEATPVHAERQSATPAADAADAAEPDEAAPPPTPATAAPPAEPPTVRLRLAVYDLSTRRPVDGFRWRFTSAGERRRGETDGATLALGLLDFDRGELLVEADGMQPHRLPDLRLPAPGEPCLVREVFLTPTPTAVGIELWVTDPDGAPVPHVRVDAFATNPADRHTAWHLGPALWARDADSADGHYQLPPLPVGEFGIRLVATSADGLPLPLSAYRGSFRMTGSNGFVEHVALEPACALRLDLLEPNGAPFDPAVHGNVTITLNRAGETAVQRKWSARTADGRFVTALDHVPAKGTIWPREPVAPGTYLLEVFVNGDPRVHRTMVLGPTVQTERITVR